MGYRNYSTAVGHIVDQSGLGDFTTIGSALAVATSGQTIFIRSGTYSENITIPGGVNLTAYDFDEGSTQQHVIISGSVTVTASGYVGINAINIEANGAAAINITGSNTLNVTLQSCCVQNASTYPCASVNNANATLVFINTDLISNSSSTAIFSVTTCNTIYMKLFKQYNAAAASTIAAGSWLMEYCDWSSPITTSGTALFIASYCTINIANSSGSLTCGGSGTHQIYYSTITAGGSSTALIVNTGVNLVDCLISSSATNVITGTGTLTSAPFPLLNSSTGTGNTVTTNVYYQTGGIMRLPNQPCFSAYKSSTSSNVTGDGAAYTVIFDTEIFDQGSNYNTSTGTFTAPVAGKYLFTTVVNANTISSAMTLLQLSIVTTAQTYVVLDLSPTAVKDSNSGGSFAGQVIANMSSGDMATVVITISNGSSNSAQVYGQSASPRYTFFTGHLVA
jgi:hypothetical protein